MCPPGVDQTTRSSQQWHILAPLAKEQHDVNNDCNIRKAYNNGLLTFLKGDFTWNAFEKLVDLTSLDACDIETVLAKLPQSTNTGGLAAIEALPSELLAMILDDSALETADVLAFGLCSRMLWQHCMSHVRKSLCKGGWANTPLVCTGTHLSDLPETIHKLFPSLKEEEEYLQALRPQPGQGMRSGPGMSPARRWNWNAVDTYEDVSITNADKWLGALDALTSDSYAGVPSDVKKILRKGLKLILAASRPKPRSPWLLRDHNTQQYVHLKCAFNGAMEPQLHVKRLPWLTLDKTLLIRISWTSLLPTHQYTPTTMKVLRGQWAGHRFDVIQASEDERPGMKGWQDITAEVHEEGRQWKSTGFASR